MKILFAARIFAVASVAFLAACSRTTADANAARTPEIPIVPVAQVTTQDLSRNLILTAEFKPYQEVDVMAKVAGYVKQINVDVGDRVNEGQLLATLEIPEMDDDLVAPMPPSSAARPKSTAREDELTAAESAHEIADLSYTSASTTSRKKRPVWSRSRKSTTRTVKIWSPRRRSPPPNPPSIAQEQVHVNQADVARVQDHAGLHARHRALRGRGHQALCRHRLHDPGRHRFETQAMPLVRLSENSLLRLILPVPESAVPTVHIGQQVEVRVPSLEPHFPRQGRAFRRQALARHPHHGHRSGCPESDLVLIPGMYAEVNLTLARRNRVLRSRHAVDIELSSDEHRAEVAVVTPEPSHRDSQGQARASKRPTSRSPLRLERRRPGGDRQPRRPAAGPGSAAQDHRP